MSWIRIIGIPCVVIGIATLIYSLSGLIMLPENAGIGAIGGATIETSAVLIIFGAVLAIVGKRKPK